MPYAHAMKDRIMCISCAPFLYRIPPQSQISSSTFPFSPWPHRSISLLDKLVANTPSISDETSLHLPWSLLLSSYENSIPSEREMSDATKLASLGTSGLMSILPNGNILRRLSSPGGGGSPQVGGRKRGVFSGAGRRLGEEESGGAMVQIERSSIPLRELSVIQTMSAAQGKYASYVFGGCRHSQCFEV